MTLSAQVSVQPCATEQQIWGIEVTDTSTPGKKTATWELSQVASYPVMAERHGLKPHFQR